MELQHVNVKIFLEGELRLDTQRIVEAFHRWTSKQALPELLIDVADYRHVPAGPGIVLVGLHADYALDHGGQRWGLLYNRKSPLGGDDEDRLRQALAAAARACQLLEAEFPEQLRFSRREFEVVINDRLLAPNTPATLAYCEPLVSRFFSALGCPDHHCTNDSEPRRRFNLHVQLERPLDFARLALPAA